MTPARPEDQDQGLIERLAAALVRDAHVSIWAADRHFTIMLWNRGAEQIYGHRTDDALGKNYLELFVDEVEREQSRIDCLRIIDYAYRQHNGLAFDSNHRGTRTHMLTNCFPITDPKTGEVYQAEIGIEISDLELREHEHRELREVGVERRALQKESLDRRRQVLIDRGEAIRTEVLKVYTVKKTELDKWMLGARDARDKSVIEPMYKAKMKELDDGHRDDVKSLQELANRIVCASGDDLDLLGLAVDDLLPRLRTLDGGGPSGKGDSA